MSFYFIVLHIVCFPGTQSVVVYYKGYAVGVAFVRAYGNMVFENYYISALPVFGRRKVRIKALGVVFKKIL